MSWLRPPASNPQRAEVLSPTAHEELILPAATDFTWKWILRHLNLF